MKILESRLADRHAEAAWDQYVVSHASARFFHLSAWAGLIERNFSFKPYYLHAEQDGACCGVLPLFLVERPLLGKALISNPCSVSAGILADSHEARDQLAEAARNTTKRLGARYVELRDTDGEPTSAPWQHRSSFSGFEKALDTDNEQNFSRIPNRQRAVLRKAESCDLETVHHRDVRRFYAVYSVSMRNLGTPLFARGYYEQLLQVFGNQAGFTTVSRHGEDLTTVLWFRFNGRRMPYYGGGTPAARQYHAFPFMYWQLMKTAVNEGDTIFDFGRSPNSSGAFHFKKNLGFVPTPMVYSFASFDGKEVPELLPDNPKVALLTNIWRHLPVSLTRLLGPIGAVYAV